MASRKEVLDEKEKIARQLAQNLRNDFHLLSNEAKKKYPSVKEASERGGMRLKHLSEQYGFSLKVLSATEDVVRPLLFACESQNPRLISISLSSLQRLIQYNAIPQSSINSILVTLERLIDNNLEELKVLQTIVILSTATDHIKGKNLTTVLIICFKLYNSNRDINIHNTASVTIRQIVQSIFDRLSQLAEKGGLNSPEPPPPDSSPSVSVDHRQLPVQVRDGYLIFQDLCFLINGDPAAWLPQSIEIELRLGLELLEIVLKGYPAIFAKEKLFSVLLTERVCPLVIKLFSPSSKHRHLLSPSSSSSLLHHDKPTFGLHIRLLRLLRILIKEYFIILITQCEIFLSMLVRFLDGDKPLWQRILAVEVLHLFANDSFLLKSFYECYDMHEHSTKVFKDIVDGIASFMQSSIHNPSSTTATNTSAVTTTPGGNVHVFQLRSNVVQYDRLSSSAPNKPHLLEMLDKADVPTIPEGYSLILSMNVIMDLIRSLSLIIHQQGSPPPSAKTFSSSLLGNCPSVDLSTNLLNSCWSAILASLSLLLDMVVDDITCKKILEVFRIFIELCGTMKLSSPCAAFLTVLCKGALPPKYSVQLVAQPQASRYTNNQSKASDNRKLNEPTSRKKISEVGVVVGGVMGGDSLQEQGKCTGKNIDCILTLLHLINQHGNVLESSWHLILTTLQYIRMALGISKMKTGFNSTAMVSGDKRSEIIAKFDGLFTNSKFLSESSLLILISSLCTLSDESLQNKDVCLFPVYCLLEVGISNINRHNAIWKPITDHLVQLCNCTDSVIRLEAADALISLIKKGLSDLTDTQSSLLDPLLSLSEVSHADVTLKQMECIEQLLHINQTMSQDTWIIILKIINNVSKVPNEALVRSGFQSLQLIVTDYLQLLPPVCLPVCLQVTGQYGQQNQDINISLTSIGQLWNIADYLYHNHDTLMPVLQSIEDKTLQSSSLGVYDSIWMILFQSLSNLIINEQSAIRKSAAQTLFSTLSVHGSILQCNTWQAVLWSVLLVVLNKVQQSVMSASTTSLGSKLMIHHSRDTAQKQWAETQVLVLNGISRIIQSRLSTLCVIDGFDRAWTTLLDIIKDCSLSNNNEVELAALSSFGMILNISNEDKNECINELWEKAWSVWVAIGNQKVTIPPTDSVQEFIDSYQSLEDTDQFFANIPSQSFLSHYLEIFPLLVRHYSVTRSSLSTAANIFRNSLSIPVPRDVSPFLVPSFNDSSMTTVHRRVILCISCLITDDSVFEGDDDSKSSLINRSHINNMERLLTLHTDKQELVYAIIKELLHYSTYSWLPDSLQYPVKSPIVSINMNPFGMSCLVFSVQILKSYIFNNCEYVKNYISIFLKTLHVPLKRRYSLNHSSLWIVPLHSLIAIINVCVPILLQQDYDDSVWNLMGDVFKDFLFAEMSDDVNMTNEDIKNSEELDIKLIKSVTSLLFEEDSSTHAPHAFINSWTLLLNRGSFISDTSAQIPFRENFAQTCFELLLKISFMEGQANTSYSALNAILERSESVMMKYIDEERLSGNCPPSRSSMNEVTLVLKSITFLIKSLKDNKSVKSSLWPKLCSLYPVLVDCVTCNCLEVRISLKDTLNEFADVISKNIAQ